MSDNLRMNSRDAHSLDTGYLTEIGLLRQAPKPVGTAEPRRWPVDIYLTDCVLAGTLEGPHSRLSDYIRSADDLLTLDACTIRSLRSGSTMAENRSALITVQNILFVVDRSLDEPRDGTALHVEKRTQSVLMGVGRFWIRGLIHLPSGGDLHNYVRGATGSFLPVTDVEIASQDEHRGRTILINRAHLRCLVT